MVLRTANRFSPRGFVFRFLSTFSTVVYWHFIFLCPLPGGYKSLCITQACLPGSARAFTHPFSSCSIHYCTISYMYVSIVRGKSSASQLAPRECILTDPHRIMRIFVALFLVLLMLHCLIAIFNKRLTNHCT